MIIPRKISPNAVLKNLSDEKQAAIIEYMDGKTGKKGHTLAETVAWLQRSGIQTTITSLSRFRVWYLVRRKLDAHEVSTLEVVRECKRRGWIKTAEEERTAGQIFFNRMALDQQDPKLWGLMQRINLFTDKVVLDKKKMELESQKYKDTRGEITKVVKKPKLSPDEKQARIRQILGTE